MENSFTFVVIGGGIAGVSCVETLAFLNQNCSILLITSSRIVKAVSSAVSITKTITELSIEEVDAKNITKKYPNIKIIVDVVTKLNNCNKTIETKNNLTIFFKKLCICTGAKPNLVQKSNPYVIGIRDTESVLEFQNKIKSARRIMVVGNGGIASEIIHEVLGVNKIWVIKDNHITKTFLDPGAGEFFHEVIYNKNEKETCESVVKQMPYMAFKSEFEAAPSITNPALGPYWHKHFHLCGPVNEKNIIIEFNTEISTIQNGDETWPIIAKLSNKKEYGIDFIVSATGVSPNSETFAYGNNELEIAPDGGIVVDEKMETTLKDVFAAGDVCFAGWELAQHWHQMRLWTQARQMGSYSAKCMMASLTNETVLQDFCFEIFSHVTRLYGFKVILLGLFNGQKLGNDYELLLRMTKGKEYVKLVLKNGKMQGALLIGDTELEEMCENLILNQLDLTCFGEDLLNPDIDIEDYFD